MVHLIQISNLLDSRGGEEINPHPPQLMKARGSLALARGGALSWKIVDKLIPTYYFGVDVQVTAVVFELREMGYQCNMAPTL